MGIDLKIYQWVKTSPPVKVREKIHTLRDMREAAEIKQGDVAKLLKVYQPQVSALETNGTASIKFTARYIETMCGILNINYFPELEEVE